MCIFSRPLSIGYVYCISRDGMSECYIGSTFDFDIRKGNHISVCNNVKSKSHNLKVYSFIRENGGFQKWKMEIIEKVLASTQRQLDAYEDIHIIKLKPALNSCRAKRSREQYYIDNKEKLNKKSKEHYLENREELKKYKNIKVECCCGGRFTKTHKARHNDSARHKKYMYQGIIYVRKKK